MKKIGYMIILGKCTHRELKTLVEKAVGARLYETNNIDVIIKSIEEEPYCSAVIVASEIMSETVLAHEQIKKIHDYHPSMPIMVVYDEIPDQKQIDQVAKYGVCDYIIKKDDCSIHLIINKMKLFYELNLMRSKTDNALKRAKDSNRKLSQNTRAYVELMTETHTAFVYLNIQGIMLDTNQSFADMIGVKDKNRLKGKSIYDFVVEKDFSNFEIMWDSLKSGKPAEDISIRFYSPNKNTSRWLSIRGALIRQTQNRIIWLVRDVTEQKVAEQKTLIAKRKKQDRLRQTLSKLRGDLNNMSKKCKENS